MDWQEYPHMPHLAMSGHHLLGVVEWEVDWHWWIIDTRTKETVLHGIGVDEGDAKRGAELAATTLA